MIGAIAGDVIGSVHEHLGTKSFDFELFPPGCRFTDDTVLTVAVAECLLSGSSYIDAFHEYFFAYPDAGYGYNFFQWASSGDRKPYNSWGNGAAMRISAVGQAFDRLEDVLAHAARATEVTHNHPEGIKGAQATAAAVFLARQGESKKHIQEAVERMFEYDLHPTLEMLRPEYRFDVSCQGTVPPALIAFLESNDYEDAVRKAISLGGDADTLACITGAVSEAHYGGVPAHIETGALAVLDDRLRGVVKRFQERYPRRTA
jgi:ADP-ribosylglycohydrolase